MIHRNNKSNLFTIIQKEIYEVSRLKNTILSCKVLYCKKQDKPILQQRLRRIQSQNKAHFEETGEFPKNIKIEKRLEKCAINFVLEPEFFFASLAMRHHLKQEEQDALASWSN